jgi:hypothetical protein
LILKKLASQTGLGTFSWLNSLVVVEYFVLLITIQK